MILAPEGVNQAHLLFQVERQPEEYHDSNRIGRIENHHNAWDLSILENETQRNGENEEVQEQEDFGSTHGWPMAPILEQSKNDWIQARAWQPGQVFPVARDQQILQNARRPGRIEQAKEESVEDGGCDHAPKVEEVQIVRLVKLILAEYPMENAIAVIRVQDALDRVEQGWDYGHVSREKERAVGQHGAETTHDEEEELDDWEQNRPVDEFVENDAQSPMQYRAMLEEQVADTVNVSHLHVWAGQQVTLLVAFRDSYGDVCLQAGELVGLVSHHRDHVALLALDAELPDSCRQVSLLVRCHSGTHN